MQRVGMPLIKAHRNNPSLIDFPYRIANAEVGAWLGSCPAFRRIYYQPLSIRPRIGLRAQDRKLTCHGSTDRIRFGWIRLHVIRRPR